MEKFNFKTLGTKLARHEADLVETYCRRKGTTPSKLIKGLLLKEINIAVPNNVAGKNIIEYKKETDAFSWKVKLDSTKTTEVIESMSPQYLEDLLEIISEAVIQRNSIINKKKTGSSAIPVELLKRGF